MALGQPLVALVIAQFAARIPLSGSSYQWASHLAIAVKGAPGDDRMAIDVTMT